MHSHTSIIQVFFLSEPPIFMQYFLRTLINWHLRAHELNDASCYEKTKSDRFESTKEEVVNVRINETTGEYEIRCGVKQSLSQGHVKIYFNNQWYSSQAKDIAHRLIFVSYQKAEVNSKLGPAEQHALIWKLPSTDITIETKILLLKNDSTILFSTQFPQGLSACSTGSKNIPGIQFPIFLNKTSKHRLITYKDRPFSPPTKQLLEYANAPVCLFDDQLNIILMSALNDFATNLITLGIHPEKSRKSYANEQFVLGCSGLVNPIPEGYQMEFIMIFGQGSQKGINRGFQRWGDYLHQFHVTSTRMVDPYTNLMNSHIGYFTDAGSYYYYNPLPGTKFDETLIAIEKYYTETEQIPFAYYHLDSWWYPKTKKPSAITSLFAKLSGGSSAGGCLLWEPSDTMWNHKPAEIFESMHHKPFTAHNRWYDAQTPYRAKFPMIEENGWAMPTTLSFWQMIMESAVQNNIIIHEQDWMDTQYRHFTHLSAQIGEHRKWLEFMNQAALEKNIHIQYCMATPAQFLESVRLDAVINCRTTRDYHAYMNIEQYLCPFTQNAMFLNAVGKWPFLDTFFCSNHQPHHYFQEKWPDIKVLMNALGGGPFAPGDEIGTIDLPLLFRACRADGSLLKPDRSLSAIDLMYIPHNIPYIASTLSTHGNHTWYYVFSMKIHASNTDGIFHLEDLDIIGDYVEFDWFAKSVKKRTNQDVLIMKFKMYDARYLIYAPLFPNGMALIGDLSKYVTCSKKQFSEQIETQHGIMFTLDHVGGDQVNIGLYTDKIPSQISINNTIITEFTYSHNLLQIPHTFATAGQSRFEIIP